MIGITIGVGEGWVQAARYACARVHELTGLTCHSIEENFLKYSHPAWLKLKLIELFPKEDAFFYFDADILMMKRWDVCTMFEEMGRPFMAVPDVRGRAVDWECHKHDLPYPDWYINGGILVFGREHGHVMADAFKRYPEYGSWLEQTALNKAILHTQVEICRLPRTYNTIVWPYKKDYSPASFLGRSEIVLHAACLGERIGTLLDIQKTLPPV